MQQGRNLNEARSADDIQLAYDTMVFLAGVKDKSKFDLRSLVASLCDFQFRFSIPMALPFGLGKDFPKKLPTPRPVELLQELKLLWPVGAAPANEEEHDCIVTPDGHIFVLVGSKMWRESSGSDTKDSGVHLSAFRWLKDLFEVFLAEKHRPEARRLAACWYYTASEANYDEDSESAELQSDEEDLAGRAVTGTLLSIFSPGHRADPEQMDEDEEGDEDFVPKSASGSESVESDAEGEGEDEEEGGVERMDTSQGKADGENDNDDVDERDGNDEGDAAKEAELEQATQEIRQSILSSVQQLHSFMPSPKTHMSWFKRMLVQMQPGAVDLEWFPFGVPPVQRILDDIQAIEQGGSRKLTAEEDAASDFLRELLIPFMQMQEQAAAAKK